MREPRRRQAICQSDPCGDSSTLGRTSSAIALNLWCRGADLNCRHRGFQPRALPLSYPGARSPFYRLTGGGSRVSRLIQFLAGIAASFPGRTQTEGHMKVGTIRETKIEEYRVGLTPTGVAALAHAGHQVFVERGGGAGAGLSDEQYEAAGATLRDSAREVAEAVDLLVKVKEPLEPEYPLLTAGLILFT